ncbi:MAG TPA: cytochrome c [Burkholderiaceae bacterium]
MNKIILSGFVAIASLVSASACAGDNVEAGKAVVAKYNCGSCHGADLNSPIAPDYPKLAGQIPDYVAHALKAYQRGDAGANANGRVQPVMGAMAKQLNDQEIKDVAAYIGSLPGNLITVTEPKFRK